jgi:hypothetical protein
MVGRQPGRAQQADDARDEGVVNARDAQREPEDGDVQVRGGGAVAVCVVCVCVCLGRACG